MNLKKTYIYKMWKKTHNHESLRAFSLSFKLFVMAIPVIIPQLAMAIHQIAMIGNSCRAFILITPNLSMQDLIQPSK